MTSRTIWHVLDQRQVKRLEQLGFSVVPTASLAGLPMSSLVGVDVPEGSDVVIQSDKRPVTGVLIPDVLPDDVVAAGVAAAEAAVPRFAKSIKDEDEATIVRAAVGAVVAKLSADAEGADPATQTSQPAPGGEQES